MSASSSEAKRPKRDSLIAGLGLLAALPGIYFFIGSLLKYELGLLPEVEIFVPPPLVMIGGLVVAFGMNLFALRPSESAGQAEHGQQSRIKMLRAKPWNLLVVGVAALFLVLLLGYVVVENLAH